MFPLYGFKRFSIPTKEKNEVAEISANTYIIIYSRLYDNKNPEIFYKSVKHVKMACPKVIFFPNIRPPNEGVNCTGRYHHERDPVVYATGQKLLLSLLKLTESGGRTSS